MPNTVDKERIANTILLSRHKSDDQKLFEIFQIYKEDIRKEYNELYYALLGWKDSHLREFDNKLLDVCDHEYVLTKSIPHHTGKLRHMFNTYNCKKCGNKYTTIKELNE